MPTEGAAGWNAAAVATLPTTTRSRAEEGPCIFSLLTAPDCNKGIQARTVTQRADVSSVNSFKDLGLILGRNCIYAYTPANVIQHELCTHAKSKKA